MAENWLNPIALSNVAPKDLTCQETVTRWEGTKFQAYIPIQKHQIFKDGPTISCKSWKKPVIYSNQGYAC